MTRPVVVLRPAPGDAETAARLVALGLTVVQMPLFAVAPVAWTPPASDSADAILFTSANALRHGGAGLERLTHLPVVAVGAATAEAARAAGFAVAIVGDRDAAAAAEAASAAGYDRLLHLGGRDRVAAPGATTVTLYASEPVIVPSDAVRALARSVVLLHSARASEAFGGLLDGADAGRATIRIAAISPAVATAAGPGWETLVAADAPSDAALVALAQRLAIDP